MGFHHWVYIGQGGPLQHFESSNSAGVASLRVLFLFIDSKFQTAQPGAFAAELPQD